MNPSFLDTPETTPEIQALYDDDVETFGFVMNASQLWAHRPEAFERWADMLRSATAAGKLSFRERGILVLACAATRGDSYCAVAWGTKLAEAKDADADTAAAVLRGDDHGLTPAEQAMARWARQVARDPNGTSEADVQALRDAGFSDTRIFAITLFVASRVAFATVNDALGALPDAGFRTIAPAAVLDAVTYGRPFDDS